MKQSIVLGSRGSDLALTQARLVDSALRNKWPGLDIETKIVKTSGDEGVATKPVMVGNAGRKGMFTAEIERALIAGTIDVAVHSAKDLPSVISGETEIAAVLPRAPLEDVLVSVHGYDLASLPRAAVVATGSVRRHHQLRFTRPDLNIVDLRGNVPTRMRKLIQQSWDAVVLARAGLERLGYNTKDSPVEFEGGRLSLSVLPCDIFVSAGGQGIIAMQIRSDDQRTRGLITPISDDATAVCLRAEREFLRLLHADCNQPVGVVASVSSNLKMRGQIFRGEGSNPLFATVEGTIEHAERVAAELLEQINGF